MFQQQQQKVCHKWKKAELQQSLLPHLQDRREKKKENKGHTVLGLTLAQPNKHSQL